LSRSSTFWLIILSIGIHLAVLVSALSSIHTSWFFSVGFIMQTINMSAVPYLYYVISLMAKIPSNLPWTPVSVKSSLSTPCWIVSPWCIWPPGIFHVSSNYPTLHLFSWVRRTSSFSFTTTAPTPT
jgi:hypothetical protein